MSPPRPVVCARFTAEELEALEAGRQALGVVTLAQFVHDAAVGVGRGLALGLVTVHKEEE